MRVSFVVATNGKRDFIEKTLESCRKEGRALESYEIVVAGNVGSLEPADDLVLVPDRVAPPPAEPRFVWSTGCRKVSHPWTAILGDDMTLAEGWGRALQTFECNVARRLYGELRYPTGKALEKNRIINNSIVGVFDSKLWSAFPIGEFYGEDAHWASRLNRASVPHSFVPGLAWIDHGNETQGGFRSSYVKSPWSAGQYHREMSKGGRRPLTGLAGWKARGRRA